MYGRSDAPAASPGGLTPGGGGSSRGGPLGAIGGSSRRSALPPGVAPEMVAAAQELTSKPVAELLAGSNPHLHHTGGGASVSSMDGDGPTTSVGQPRSVGASRLSDDSADEYMGDRYSQRGDDFYDGSGDDGGSLVSVMLLSSSSSSSFPIARLCILPSFKSLRSPHCPCFLLIKSVCLVSTTNGKMEPRFTRSHLIMCLSSLLS